jgi:hypothetical protein
MASPIDPKLAKQLIKEYQHENAAPHGPGLKTPDGSFINGFFIDRKNLEAIFATNPEAVGISINFAKHPEFSGKPDKVYTIAFSGAKKNTDHGAKAPYIRCGEFYSIPPPCPPWCMDPC